MSRTCGLRPAAVVVVVLLGLGLGVCGADAAIIVHRHGLARPAVVRPAPRANPSPVLTDSAGGAR